LHNLLHIPINNIGSEVPKISNLTILTELTEYFSSISLFIIDEISVVSADFFEICNKRLQQIFKNDKPFGGLPVIIVGDMFQFPPIHKKSMIETISEDNKKRLNVNEIAGTNLFNKFKIYQLKENHRAKKDPRLAKQIKNMRNRTTMQPINDDIIKTLTKSQLTIDGGFLDAPIIVSSNHERHILNSLRIQQCANQRNQIVLRWKNPLTDNTIEKLDNICQEVAYKVLPELYGYFMIGTPCYLHDNINASEGLANGTPIVLHSIKFNDIDYEQKVINDISISKIGDIIDIPIPSYINVKVPSLKNRDWPQNLNLATKVEGDNNDVIIPLTIKSSHTTSVILDKKNKNLNISYKSFHYDVGYAITYEKTEGQTMKHVILDLNHRPRKLGKISFNSLYVGFP